MTFAVRGGNPFEAEDRSVGCDRFNQANPVGRQQAELDFARLVGLCHEGFAVRHEARIAVAHSCSPRHLHKPPLLYRRHKYLAARSERQSVPGWREMDGCQKVQRLFHPALTLLVKIRSESDVEQPFLAILEVQQAQVRALLVNDAPPFLGRRLHVVFPVLSVLAQIRSVGLSSTTGSSLHPGRC